jgi:hypothetical protein
VRAEPALGPAAVVHLGRTARHRAGCATRRCRRRRSAIADADAPETNWNRALEHEARCEWGHAIDRWLRARGRGLDDDAIAFQLASCYGFAGVPDAGLAALERFGDRAVLPDPLRGRVELARSALLLRAGRRDEAARATIVSEKVLSAAQFGLPIERLYDGQPLHGKRLLVVSYGGIGDQLQYARYLHALDALGCAAVTVIVPAALATLMRHTFPQIEFVAAQGPWIDASELAHDYWCSFLVLAAIFGFAPAPEHAPTAYLSCPPERAAAWRERIARDGSARHAPHRAELARSRRERRTLSASGQRARSGAARTPARTRGVLHEPRNVRAVRADGSADHLRASCDRGFQRPGRADARDGRGRHDLHRAYPSGRRVGRAGSSAAEPEGRCAGKPVRRRRCTAVSG